MTHETESASFGNAREGDPKHSQARRRLLKALAGGGGAVVATQTLPDRWAKPQIQVGVLPAHAQASPVTSLACSLLIQDQTLAEGNHTIDIGSDPGTDIEAIQATLSPAAAGVDVTVTFTANPGSDATFDTAVQDVLTNGAGLASFADIGINFGVDFDGAQDHLAGFDATYSTPGAVNCEIDVNFSGGGGGG